MATRLLRLGSRFSGSPLQALCAPYSIFLIYCLTKRRRAMQVGLTSFVDMADDPVPRNHSGTHSIPEQ
jgi:hypothetical protein